MQALYTNRRGGLYAEGSQKKLQPHRLSRSNRKKAVAYEYATAKGFHQHLKL
jgi:hypothetical protein